MNNLPSPLSVSVMQDRSTQDGFAQDAYQVAYIFDPQENTPQPLKKRKLTRQTKPEPIDESNTPSFAPLLNGAEGETFVRLRRERFEQAWGLVNGRIETTSIDQIPSAFIITGPNIAPQDLLFEQLSEALPRSYPDSKFVRLKSSEALTLKAALKKTIRDATNVAAAGREDKIDGGVDADADAETTRDDFKIGNILDGRRYLDYDLEALEAYVKPLQCEHVFVAFQDSEGFESGLLSDLITLFQ
ncbi:hypothetical protein E4U43_002995 [Claviceps pusilla]|uniref:Origin recognition complex subunit 3 N-terminal domain-containing protein n=1 Tax=Claviceps pusilla TaxID=123648 RepID=A0A9P7N6M6_9HYPO|nr:hypothetical protein E4U43_002995 [Claviceps pusilla]